MVEEADNSRQTKGIKRLRKTKIFLLAMAVLLIAFAWDVYQDLYSTRTLFFVHEGAVAIDVPGKYLNFSVEDGEYVNGFIAITANLFDLSSEVPTSRKEKVDQLIDARISAPSKVNYEKIWKIYSSGFTFAKKNKEFDLYYEGGWVKNTVPEKKGRAYLFKENGELKFFILCKGNYPQCRWRFRSRNNLMISASVSRQHVNNWRFVLEQTGKLLDKFNVREMSPTQVNNVRDK
jgi:hypothetical protein